MPYGSHFNRIQFTFVSPQLSNQINFITLLPQYHSGSSTLLANYFHEVFNMAVKNQNHTASNKGVRVTFARDTTHTMYVTLRGQIYKSHKQPKVRPRK